MSYRLFVQFYRNNKWFSIESVTDSSVAHSFGMTDQRKAMREKVGGKAAYFFSPFHANICHSERSEESFNLINFQL
jgi:hypothetical protein